MSQTELESKEMVLSEKSFAREASSPTDIYSSTDSANSDSNGAEESVLISEMSSYK